MVRGVQSVSRCYCAAAHRAPRRFHVDKLSSAHVYMRVQRGQTLADLSKEARTQRRGIRRATLAGRPLRGADARPALAAARRSWRTAASW